MTGGDHGELGISPEIADEMGQEAEETEQVNPEAQPDLEVPVTGGEEGEG